MELSHHYGIPSKYYGIPVAPFALAEGEVLQRPEVVRRLTFDDVCLWGSVFETALFQRPIVPAGRFGRSIVPIELAQMGDEQVVVHSPAGETSAPPFCVDALADLPSVVSVVADRLVMASRPLPQVHELFQVGYFSKPVDQGTLANLPGLVSLSLGSGWGSEKLDLEVLRTMPGLRDLQFEALAVRSIEPLRFLRGIERLKIGGIASERIVGPLAGLPKLRYLHLECWKGLRKLGALENLEHVSLMDASLANLKAFKAWSKVQALALSGGGVRSLEGIDALESLQELFLGGAGIRDLAPLVEAKNPRLLKLNHPDRIADFTPIGRLNDLQSLVIGLGSISTIGHLPSISFLAGLEQLQEFELRGAVIDDGRLDVLFNLPKLRRVMLLGDFGRQVDRLRRQKPECSIEVIPLACESATEVVQVGSVTIRKYEEDLWSIFEDLSSLLQVEDNFAANRRVRQAIRQRDVALALRLEFDPDADFVSIKAKTEADIRRAAEIIQSIPLEKQ